MSMEDAVTTAEDSILDLTFLNKLTDTSDFELTRFLRAAFTRQKFDGFEETAHKVPFWIKAGSPFVYWTENHLAGILVGECLVMQQLKRPLNNNRLHTYLDARLELGFSEFCSPPYFPFMLAAILNLYDFVEDEDLKSKAKTLLDKAARECVAVCNRIDFSFASATTRIYPNYYDSTAGNPINMWIDFIFERAFSPNLKAPLYFCLLSTGYRPPSALTENTPDGSEIIRMTAPSVPSKYPIWICWSYGIYAPPLRLFGLLHFFLFNKIYTLEDFKALRFVGYLMPLYPLVYLLVLILYPILAAAAYFALRFVWYTNASVRVTRITNLSRTVQCVVTSLEHYHEGLSAAQQWPWTVSINGKTIYAIYGSAASVGVRKHVLEMKSLPFITHEADLDIGRVVLTATYGKPLCCGAMSCSCCEGVVPLNLFVDPDLSGSSDLTQAFDVSAVKISSRAVRVSVAIKRETDSLV